MHSKRLFCILIISVVWTPLLTGATQSEEPEKYNLKIDSQSLGSALQEFARQSGVQIIFFSQVTEGFRSPALDGQYTLANALQMLLAGSNLTFRVINYKTIEIRPLTAAGPLDQEAVEAEIKSNWRAALNFNSAFDRVCYQTVGGRGEGGWYGEPRNLMVRFDGRC